MTSKKFKYFLMLLIVLTLFVSTPLQRTIFIPTISNYKQFLADVKCMETNIYREAIGEPVAGQIAVGLVTINRTKSDSFPKTICKVVHQPYQFSWTADNPSHVKVPPYIHELAFKIMTTNIPDFTNGALYFRRYDIGPVKSNMIRIGDHVFY